MSNVFATSRGTMILISGPAFYFKYENTLSAGYFKAWLLPEDDQRWPDEVTDPPWDPYFWVRANNSALFMDINVLIEAASACARNQPRWRRH